MLAAAIAGTIRRNEKPAFGEVDNIVRKGGACARIVIAHAISV
jgi:hypothetical protein